MTGFGILNFIALALELCVPSYALRLVRRFGAAQVGSFVIIAFLSLALLHLVNPLKPSASSSLTLSMVYGVASLLLLIGMGHTETVCGERQQAQMGEEQLRVKLDTEARERAENLLQIKQEMAQEIVRLQQQVETLSASERQYRLLYTQHPHPMWMFDLRTGRILTGNQAALAQYGFSQQEFTALYAKDLLAREAAESFLADAGKPCSSLEQRGIWRHRKKDRTTVDVEVMAMDLRFGDCPARLMFVEDIGPRQARESQLCDQHRMHLLRQVAEGVAHHFGRILSAVDGQVDRLKAVEPTGHTERFEQLLAETRRGGALLRQLLAAGGCGSIQGEAIDLNGFVLKHETLLHRLVGERVALQVQLAEGLSPVLADDRVLEQIIVSLVLNSRQALPQGGAIEISTQAAWGDASQPQPNALPGHFVRLSVRDNGCGIVPEVQRRLFEPFFTTRNHDQAMGLGLATVYGAIKQLGGWVEFVSQPHAGTEFSVFLPVAQLIARSAAVEESLPAQASRETILLVESSDRVRDLARHILQRHGYRVVEIDGFTTAILLMESLAGQAHLLITDLSFPTGESGRELAEQFLQINPKLQVVYATAPVGSDENPESLPQEPTLLLKPYTADQLLKTVGSCFSRS